MRRDDEGSTVPFWIFIVLSMTLSLVISVCNLAFRPEPPEEVIFITGTPTVSQLEKVAEQAEPTSTAILAGSPIPHATSTVKVWPSWTPTAYPTTAPTSTWTAVPTAVPTSTPMPTPKELPHAGGE